MLKNLREVWELCSNVIKMQKESVEVCKCTATSNRTEDLMGNTRPQEGNFEQ